MPTRPDSFFTVRMVAVRTSHVMDVDWVADAAWQFLESNERCWMTTSILQEVNQPKCMHAMANLAHNLGHFH